jgi:hypothetical protein
MEPIFMILGQSALTVAVMALDGGVAIQDVPYAKLRRTSRCSNTSRTSRFYPQQIVHKQIESMSKSNNKSVA